MSLATRRLRAALDRQVPPGATGLVVALSGGADSSSLLRALVALGTGFRGLSTRAVHIDHGLSPAASEFRAVCARLCAEVGVSLTIVTVEVDTSPGVSIEAAARDARYAALAAELGNGECLLTAHHDRDQAETLLLQAMRGAGLKGMSGMPACRPLGKGWHVRPVLEVSPEDLARGAGRGAFVEDPMNADLRFDRSYLRREVWPVIEKRWPGARLALARSAGHAAEAQRLLDRAGAAEVARIRDGDALSVPALRALSPEARMNTVRFWLSETGIEPPSTAKLQEALRQILRARDDHLPAVPWGEHALRRYRQRLFLTDAEPPRLGDARTWPVADGACLDLGPRLGELRWQEQRGGLDRARLPDTVTVRARAGGETLKPSPRGRTQSVQHLLQSYGVLPWMRHAVPLIFAGDDLIAVADLWTEARHGAGPDRTGLAVVWERAPVVI
ncbi:MAG TPA: tRNA lysidine(34) synthetase TilS [Steroidobacteraceae bacterium]|jgi:tRNA(Ile)-lysidine synthase|nr:tRNA lysidine(34) synthetase TilS [Steroidobacteraceae bacterium]